MEVIIEIMILMTYLLNLNKGFHKTTNRLFTDNIVERFKANLIKPFFDSLMYKNNPRNDDLDTLTLDGDESLITRQKVYSINDNIVESLNNGLIVDVCKNLM